MKPKDITRREVARMDDEDLAKAHSEIHGIDKNLPKDTNQREKEIWEAHNILATEMRIRGRQHNTSLGVEDGSHPASSKPDSTDSEPDTDDKEVGYAGSVEDNVELGGDASDKEDLSKPYSGEHSCRILSPSKFEKDGDWARVPRKSAEYKKSYAVIRGTLKETGKMTDQAYRYKKTVWDADDARAHCKKHDGSFEAAKTDVRIKIGKEFLLLAEMQNALHAAFEDAKWVSLVEIDVDGPLVIVEFSWEDRNKMFKIPFAITPEGSIKFNLDEKVEVERTTAYNEKNAAKEEPGEVMKTGMLIKESMDDEKQFALFVVYVPDKIDSQGEWASEEEIEKMCHGFARKCYVGNGENVDMRHDGKSWAYKDIKIVENLILRNGMEKAFNLPEGTWVIGLKFENKDYWNMLKNGDIGGVSIAGQTKRRKRDVGEELKDE